MTDVFQIWTELKALIGDNPKALTESQEIEFKRIFFWNTDGRYETTNLPVMEFLSHDPLFWRYAATLAIQNRKDWYEPVLELIFHGASPESLVDLSRSILNWRLYATSFQSDGILSTAASALRISENLKEASTAVIALDSGDTSTFLNLSERFAVGNKSRVISVIFDVYYAVLEKESPKQAAQKLSLKFQQAPDFYYSRFRQLFYEVKTLNSKDYCEYLWSSIRNFEKQDIEFYIERWQEIYGIYPELMLEIKNDWDSASDKESKRWRGYKQFLSHVVEDAGETFEVIDLMQKTNWLESEELHQDLRFFAQDSDNRLYGTLCRFAQIRAIRILLQNLGSEFSNLTDFFDEFKTNWCPIHEASTSEIVSFAKTFITTGGKSRKIGINRLGLQTLQQIGRESKAFEPSEKNRSFLTRDGKLPLLRWQEVALKSWAAHGRQGLISAATGTGKSRLGVAAILEAYEDGLPIVLLTHRLAIKGQWKKDELAAISEADIHGFEMPRHLKLFKVGENVRELSCEDHYLQDDPPKARPGQILLALDKSLANKSHLLPDKNQAGLLIADEVHQFNDPTGTVILEGNFSRRMGLSATISAFEDYGLLGYFGGAKVVDYPIYKATRDKVIAEFNLLTIRSNYTPVRGFGGSSQFVELDKNNQPDVSWQDLEMAESALENFYNVLTNNEHFKLDLSQDFESQVEDILLRKDPNLMDHARAYLRQKKNYDNVLRKFQSESDPLELLGKKIGSMGKTLIFSNSKIQGKYYRDLLEQRGIRVGYMDSDTEMLARGNLLNQLQRNEIKALISPQILDEGVNLPNAKIGLFLGNGTSTGSRYRQTVQRMGRVLRKKAESDRALLVLVVGKNTREDPGISGQNRFLDNQFAVMNKHAANSTTPAIVDFEDSERIFSYLEEFTRA